MENCDYRLVSYNVQKYKNEGDILTKGDKFLIVFVVILAVISLIFIRNQGLSTADKYVSIQVNGEEIKKVIFDKKIIGEQIAINTEHGFNLVEIGDESVKVVDADCPDKIDVKQGSISKIGETIVCLPNKLVIEIKGSEKNIEETNEIDIKTN